MPELWTPSGGVNRKLKELHAVSGGANRKLKELYAVSGGVNRKVFSGSIPMSSLPVGTKVKLKENGILVNYIVVNQGKPSSSYDDSCDGTWILRESIYGKQQWNSMGTSNAYENSLIKNYLNSTFLSFFDNIFQGAIKQVKIPYWTNGGQSGTSSTLSCKIFLISMNEAGLSYWDNQYIAPGGSKLSYFDSGTGTTANNKRIAYLSASATGWSSRSPWTPDAALICCFTTDGSYSFNSNYSSYGVRPALVLDFDTNVLSTPDTDGVYILDV